MGRRWLLVERNSETVRQFTLPRLNAVVNGEDLGGVTNAVDWKGGGDFELAYAPPRLGKAESARDLCKIREFEYQSSESKPVARLG